jgi:predicted phage terminase large subunit-like protein
MEAANQLVDPDLMREVLERRKASASLLGYILHTTPNYKRNAFSDQVCAALDKFINEVNAGLRPILVLQAPPQHGKTEMASRKFPAYLMGAFPDWRIAGLSYADDLASLIAQDVRRNINSPEHIDIFPSTRERVKYDSDRTAQFINLRGTGSYISSGVGGPLTGKSVDIGIIDDPIKNQQEALSPTTKEQLWNWYQATFTTRLSQNSGQVIMATSWAMDDLVGRILEEFAGSPRLTHLRFPAINLPDETGYRNDLPEGALVPQLHSLDKLYETKALLSDYWWAAMYQQSPKALGGNIFKDEFVQYYLPKDLPKKFDKVISSWDCAFKDTDGSDYVVGQVWGKAGANTYLLDQVRARLSFTATAREIVAQRKKWPQIREVLIEDKANGPAVLDFLKQEVHGLIPILPDGSKESRAHATTSTWEARNIFLPHEHIAPWVKAFVAEMTVFPAGAHDDQVDAYTQAIRRLYPVFGRLKISQSAINNAMRRLA